MFLFAFGHSRASVQINDQSHTFFVYTFIILGVGVEPKLIMEYTIAELKAVCGFNVEPVYYGILQSDATYIEVQFIDKQNEGVLAVSKSNGTIIQ